MRQKYEEILHSLEDSRGRLLAVSKGQPIEKIKTLYDLGQRDFGENYAAEMVEKMEGLAASCPEIRWHYIGKIQKDKPSSLQEHRGYTALEAIGSGLFKSTRSG